MRHIDEARLMELRDGAATTDRDALEHLDACAACAGTLEELTTQRADVASALSVLDEGWDIEAARGRVRERVARGAAAAAGGPALVRRRSRAAVWSVSRAAGVLLVTAAGLSALPGSPVRAWLGRTLAPAPDAVTAPGEDEVRAMAPAAAPESTGVRVSVPFGALRVVLQDAAPGSEIRVLLVAGTEAAVYAPAGSRFTSASGRVEARVTPGEVRVELPRGVDAVSLEVGGRMYLRSTDAGLEIPGPVASRTADEIVFRIPQE